MIRYGKFKNINKSNRAFLIIDKDKVEKEFLFSKKLFLKLKINMLYYALKKVLIKN